MGLVGLVGLVGLAGLVGLVGLEVLRRKVCKLTKRVTTLESAQAGVSG